MLLQFKAAKKEFNAPQVCKHPERGGGILDINLFVLVQVSSTNGGKSTLRTKGVVGRSRRSAVEQAKLLSRVPGSAGEEHLRLASGERLSRVRGGKAWVTESGSRASADCCMPDGTVVKVCARIIAH